MDLIGIYDNTKPKQKGSGILIDAQSVGQSLTEYSTGSTTKKRKRVENKANNPEPVSFTVPIARGLIIDKVETLQEEMGEPEKKKRKVEEDKTDMVKGSGSSLFSFLPAPKHSEARKDIFTLDDDEMSKIEESRRSDKGFRGERTDDESKMEDPEMKVKTDGHYAANFDTSNTDKKSQSQIKIKTIVDEEDKGAVVNTQPMKKKTEKKKTEKTAKKRRMRSVRIPKNMNKTAPTLRETPPTESAQPANPEYYSQIPTQQYQQPQQYQQQAPPMSERFLREFRRTNPGGDIPSFQSWTPMQNDGLDQLRESQFMSINASDLTAGFNPAQDPGFMMPSAGIAASGRKKGQLTFLSSQAEIQEQMNRQMIEKNKKLRAQTRMKYGW